MDAKLYINDVMGMLSLLDGMPGMLSTTPANYVSVFIDHREDDTSKLCASLQLLQRHRPDTWPALKIHKYTLSGAFHRLTREINAVGENEKWSVSIRVCLFGPDLDAVSCACM